MKGLEERNLFKTLSKQTLWVFAKFEIFYPLKPSSKSAEKGDLSVIKVNSLNSVVIISIVKVFLFIYLIWSDFFKTSCWDGGFGGKAWNQSSHVVLLGPGKTGKNVTALKFQSNTTQDIDLMRHCWRLLHSLSAQICTNEIPWRLTWQVQLPRWELDRRSVLRLGNFHREIPLSWVRSLFRSQITAIVFVIIILNLCIYIRFHRNEKWRKFLTR